MAQSVPLSNGMQHPLLVYGTYKVGYVPASSSDNTATALRSTSDVLKEVLEVGYRALDCAQFYNNEKGVGEAIAASALDRKDLFIISKVWNDVIYQGGDAVRAQVEKSLKDLQTDYIDLYLVHWPVPGKHLEAYAALEKLHGEGKIKAIGLSNYTVEDYEELKKVMKVKPVSNQFEINPMLYRKKTIEYFKKEGLVLQSYRTLRQGKEMDNDTLKGIAKKYEKSVAQVLGRWCVQQGIVYMPKSEKRERMVENMGVFDFTLSDEDMSVISGMTTDESIEAFKQLYEKCVVRDTPLAETKEGIKKNYTAN